MSSEDKLRRELEEHFHGAVSDAAVMAECLSLCMKFNLSAEDLFYKWEAFSFNSSVKDRVLSSLTLAGTKDLHQSLLQDRAKATPVSKPPARIAAASARRPPFETPRQPQKNAPPPTRTTVPVSYQTVQVNDQPKWAPFRYMHEKISDRSEVLDDRIDEFSELVREHYGLEDLGDPAAVTEDEVVVVGRICCDADAKLNEASILLESSRVMGSGVRVPLRFDAEVKLRAPTAGRSGIGLFPGAIVALKGKNGGGGRFNVSEIWTMPPLPKASKIASPPPLSGIIACGPYTFGADLEYKPFNALLDAIRRSRPGMVLLLGPFVDGNHDLIKSGDIDQTTSEIFQSRIAQPIQKLLDSLPDVTVFLVPSPRDVINENYVFPQSPFHDDGDLDIPKRVVLLPNPCMFTVNGVSFGATTVDVILHLRKEEYFKHADDLGTALPAEKKDAMTLFCRQILEQRSFYPLFPVPVEQSKEVNLDVTHSDKLKIDKAPDVLILPSILKDFQKTVDGTVALNPSTASKASVGGSYARLTVNGGVEVEIVKL